MVRKNSGIIIAAIIAFFSLLTVACLSCNKSGASYNTCEGVVCENSGYCHRDAVTNKPKCVCPTGFAGTNCSTALVSKYLGTWNLHQVIIGSDSASHDSAISNYIVFLDKSATPTTFFIDEFSGNPYYNQIICTMDSINSYYFTIDTISAFHMVFDHYKLLYGSGTLSLNDSLINASFAVRHLSPTSNWVNDTVILTMTPHTP